ncbi:hypothetical protein [Bryobacter aggregatus]|uniref:hypothetical protein n=1 Tax=Bryobacter aggregatus TaxID=360054 RepID=UPI0012BAEBCF|nr:hypothetical protein [Bryobacter aggregatus]
MGKNVKARLRQWLVGMEEVSPAQFAAWLKETDASPAYLRNLLRQSSVRLHPLVEGVRQDSPHQLERTLSKLARLYALEPAAARACVLESKAHTRLAKLRQPNDPWKTEVLLHLNTWLENPTIYPEWAQLRKNEEARQR